MHLSLVSAAGLLASAGLAAAQSQSRFFVPPPAGLDGRFDENPVYRVGDKITFKWKSPFEEVGIIAWQSYPDGDAGHNEPLNGNYRESEFTWTVDADWMSGVHNGQDGVAFLALYMSGQTGYDVASHYFNITTRPERSGAATDADEEDESSSSTGRSGSGSGSRTSTTSSVVSTTTDISISETEAETKTVVAATTVVVRTTIRDTSEQTGTEGTTEPTTVAPSAGSSVAVSGFMAAVMALLVIANLA